MVAPSIESLIGVTTLETKETELDLGLFMVSLMCVDTKSKNSTMSVRSQHDAEK